MDCIEGMRQFPDAFFDSIVTDPPYELGFMGKSWDASGIAYSVEMWREALRVLKPGGHLLAFSGSRTYHRMVCAIEDAGFEIRDQIMWVYGSGFPKSLDVSKAIDKAAGAEREIVGFDAAKAAQQTRAVGTAAYGDYAGNAGQITAPATEAARQWQGWGTALKPAHEPIVVARKPLIGTVAANVLAHGTGAINVDGCRVDSYDGARTARKPSMVQDTAAGFGKGIAMGGNGSDLGRWPANLIHDGSDEVLAAFPQSTSVGHTPSARGRGGVSTTGHAGQNEIAERQHDRGSAARFFYCAKASKSDRSEGNIHPTVKPTDLMRYLVHLVTPPGGMVLDPFSGSGSTGKACRLERFPFIGFELSAEYTAIANARIEAARP